MVIEMFVYQRGKTAGRCIPWLWWVGLGTVVGRRPAWKREHSEWVSGMCREVCQSKAGGAQLCVLMGVFVCLTQYASCGM